MKQITFHDAFYKLVAENQALKLYLDMVWRVDLAYLVSYDTDRPPIFATSITLGLLDLASLADCLLDEVTGRAS